MNNRRKNVDRAQTRRVVDGILNAPANRGRDVHAASQPARRPVFHERLRAADGATPEKPIGDFTQSEGYHSADHSRAGRTQGVAAKPAKRSHTVASDSYIRKQFVAAEKEKEPNRLAFLWRRIKNDKRHAHKKKLSRKALFFRGAAVAGALGVLLVGYLGITGYFNLHKIFKGGGDAVAMQTDVDPTKLRGEGDGRVNVLLLGRGGDGHDGADLTDTIMLASLDPVNKKVALISLPRDWWVKGSDNESKINAVFAFAKNGALEDGKSTKEAEQQGIEAIENTVEQITGVAIHYYAMIDFKGFEKAVNTVGGVTIDVPEELRDATMAWQNNGNPVLAPKGVQKMDGKTALMYVRSRYGSARADFDRAERQRLFLLAVKNQVMSVGTYGNPVKVARLMNDFGDHAKTDFSLNDLMRLYTLGKGISSFESISLVDEPHNFLTTDTYYGQSIVCPEAGIFAYEQIKLYLRSALPDGYIVKEKAPIVVLNGSTLDGIATANADELKTYGYSVVGVDDAPTKDYRDTVLVDLGGDKKYTKNYLEKRFGVRATTNLPTGITLPEHMTSGFVIIIGQHAATSS